jgi:hypothetical protein
MAEGPGPVSPPACGPVQIDRSTHAWVIDGDPFNFFKKTDLGNALHSSVLQ